MTHPKGTVTVEHDGSTYTLEMNFGVLADLEAEFADDFMPMLDGTKNPSIKFIVRICELSLLEGCEDMDEGTAKRIARRVTSQTLFGELVKAAFPDAKIEDEKPGKAKGPKRAA